MNTSRKKTKHPRNTDKSGEPQAKCTKLNESKKPEPSTSNVSFSVTDGGCLKVARKKKSASLKAKTKSKSEKVKLDPEETRVFESISVVSPEPEDLDVDVETIKEEHDDECTGALPWNKLAFTLNESKDLATVAADEIALEGLDGTTLDTLWIRVANALNHPQPLPRSLLAYIWNFVRQSEGIESYILETPRAPLPIPVDDEVDAVDDIYPFVPINDEENQIIGSCSTYKQRKPVDISKHTLEEAEVLGNCLVLVGTQELRQYSLHSPFVDPMVEICESSYFILEKIGRSRRRGEGTSGANSLACVTKDAKTLFYYRNRLQQMRLVSKQPLPMKTEKNVSATAGLIHLQRFYSEVKSKRQLIIEHVIKLIKQKPQCRMEYIELRRVIGIDVWERFMMTKVIKSLDFRQFVKTDVVLPYRMMYPNATVGEWQQKANEKEKSVRVLELRNPNLNVNSIFKDEKEDLEMRESSDSETEYNVPYNVLAVQKIYQAIYKSGVNGINARGLSNQTKCDHHTVRSICKNLKTAGLIFQSLQDSKRQHYILFLATAHKKQKLVKDVEELEDDPEAMDFIADALCTEASVLKVNRGTSPVQDNLATFNPYDLIKQLKLTKDETRLNKIYANEHPFTEASLQNAKMPERTKISETPKMQKFFLSIVEPQQITDQTILPVFHSKTRANESVSINDVVKKLRNTTKFPTMRRLKTFRPFKCLLNKKFNMKSLDTYMETLDTLRDVQLSSSDDEAGEDLNSEISIVSGLPTAIRQPVSKEIKRVIVDNFDLEKVSFLDKFNEPVPPIRISPNSVVPTQAQPITQQNFFNVEMELFMGPKPQIVSVTKDIQEVETMIVVSTRPADFTESKALLSNSNRVQSRIQLIKDCMSNQKLIIDLVKIQTIINQSEKSEGYTAKVDRRTLHRIFTTLVRGGHFKVIKIIVKFKDIIRMKNMMAVPHYNIETFMQSIVDQFKNSFTIYAKRKIYEQEGKLMGIVHSSRRRFKYSRHIGRTYGFNPKISKMRLLYDFIFYLVREYTGAPITREETHNILLGYCGVESIDDIMNEATTLYQREASWKMFVPPLPEHKSWPDGWALITDILLRLPVSLFVKLYNVSYIIPELPSYLNHPIRKHLIVKNLPAEVKDALVGYRKYIFSIHEIFCFLAYLGLVQFGPQKMREKDQVFFYLNTKGIIFDTSTSEPGYHQITPKEYPKLTYFLTSSVEVDKYWTDLYYYAVNSKLGNRGSVIGQQIKLEFVHAKPLLASALKPQTAESAHSNDIGYLPGDGIGACCSDSALWLHVKKNWFSYSKPRKPGASNQQIITGLRRKHLDDVRQMKFTDIHHHRKGKKFKMIRPAMSTNVGTGIKKAKVKILRAASKNKIVMRKVKPRKSGNKIRIRVDNIDRKILERMGKSRAIFTKQEDNLLLICMACNDYLCASNNKRAVSWSTVRDVMHRILINTKKTSLAYKRRTVQLRKMKSIDEQKDILSYKLSSDFFTEKHFSKIRNDLSRDSGKTVSEVDLNFSFIYLAYNTYKRWTANPNGQGHTMENATQDFLVPKTLHKYPPHSDQEEMFCKNPTTEEDVSLDTIQSVIHSSLGGQIPDQDWPYQLLRVYQSFSEDLLRKALVNLRDFQIISGRKMKQGQEGNNTILMSGVTYNLSFNYTFKQITQFPHCIFTEAHDILTVMFRRFEQLQTRGVLFEKFEQGHGLGVCEYHSKRRLHYVFDLPDDIITLNPELNDFSELVSELATRYQQLMNKSQEFEESVYEPDILNIIQASLEHFIRGEQSSANSSFVSASSSAPEAERVELSQGGQDEEGKEKGSKTDVSNFGKGDRRHKSWKISDMAFMLTKGLFPELDDDERLEKLNEHFLVRYPTCRIKFHEETEQSDEIFAICTPEIAATNNEILNMVMQDALIKHTKPDESDLDTVAAELVHIICRKGVLGISGQDLKKEYPKVDMKLLTHLIDIGIILRVGVCKFYFVHHNYRHSWSIPLSTENNPFYDKSLDGYRIRVSPWIQINGTIHVKVLEKWMSIIVSHCLSYPCLTFSRLCARFNIIKPVDIYFILEILQCLGCVQILRYVRDADEGQDIFTEFGILPQVPGSIIDDFDDVFVETETTTIVKFGAFLNRYKTDFAYTFEEEE